MRLTYVKLRRVLGLLNNKGFKELLGKNSIDTLFELSFDEIIGILEQSKLDLEILKILTDKDDVEEISALEAIEVFSDFFTLIKQSWEKLLPLLADMGLLVKVPIKEKQ
jgi:hypothetical protein